MDKDGFWGLIEASRADECEQHAANLETRLSELSASELVWFDQIFTEYFFAAYRWDLWAVAFIINGGCSDDAFMDFRNWLIAKGRQFYASALESPEWVGHNVEPEEYAGCEEIGYVASTVYERLTGMQISSDGAYKLAPKEPSGEAWTEDDLPTLYPALCEKFDC